MRKSHFTKFTYILAPPYLPLPTLGTQRFIISASGSKHFGHMASTVTLSAARCVRSEGRGGRLPMPVKTHRRLPYAASDFCSFCLPPESREVPGRISVGEMAHVVPH